MTILTNREEKERGELLPIQVAESEDSIPYLRKINAHNPPKKKKEKEKKPGESPSPGMPEKLERGTLVVRERSHF